MTSGSKRKPNWLARRRERKRLQREQSGDTPERTSERERSAGEASDPGADAKRASIGGTVNQL
ncbi:MAG TPA: hypothetical protein VK631_13295 [Solirubrobacteraceae bacterium]|nr:hypothetical protein [Solirubrobacteraceae bacterium]